jgi:hypothetical protein
MVRSSHPTKYYSRLVAPFPNVYWCPPPQLGDHHLVNSHGLAPKMIGKGSSLLPFFPPPCWRCPGPRCLTHTTAACIANTLCFLRSKISRCLSLFTYGLHLDMFLVYRYISIYKKTEQNLFLGSMEGVLDTDDEKMCDWSFLLENKQLLSRTCTLFWFAELSLAWVLLFSKLESWTYHEHGRWDKVLIDMMGWFTRGCVILQRCYRVEIIQGAAATHTLACAITAISEHVGHRISCQGQYWGVPVNYWMVWSLSRSW